MNYSFLEETKNKNLLEQQRLQPTTPMKFVDNTRNAFDITSYPVGMTVNNAPFFSNSIPAESSMRAQMTSFPDNKYVLNMETGLKPQLCPESSPVCSEDRYNDFRLTSSCMESRPNAYTNYTRGAFKGMGVGQVDGELEAQVKYGLGTREKKANDLAGITINRFQYLERNFQDPNHIILPFPRGGVITREQHYRN